MCLKKLIDAAICLYNSFENMLGISNILQKTIKPYLTREQIVKMNASEAGEHWESIYSPRGGEIYILHSSDHRLLEKGIDCY